MTKYVCWNTEEGFDIVEAEDEDAATLQCELNQPAVLLGKEEEIKKDIYLTFKDDIVMVERKLVERQITNAEKYKKHWEDPTDMDQAQSYGYWDGRLDLLNEIKRHKQ